MLPAKYSPDGKRKAKYFETKATGAAFCKKLNTYGIAALEDYVPALPKTEQDQIETAMRWALEQLNGDFRQVYEAVEHFKLTRLNVKRVSVREAIEAYQAFRRTDVDERTVRTDGPRLAKFMRGHSELQLAELTKIQMVEYFDSLKAKYSNSTIIGDCKTMRKFFKWCLNRGYLGANPMEGIETKDMGQMGVNNEFYPVATFQKMLRIAAGLEPAGTEEKPTRDFIDLLPWFVLSGFAGLRTCEAYQETKQADAIKWSDLYFEGVDHPHLYIRKEVVGKDGDPRPIDMAPAWQAVQAWLELCPRSANEDYICRLGSRAMQILKPNFSARTGINFVENGFRNSFATYALAYSSLEGLGYVSKQMGNSEAVCRKFYRQNLPTGSGKAWFGSRPFQVVSLAAAAA
jgi:site-specific recombinase XerC